MHNLLSIFVFTPSMSLIRLYILDWNTSPDMTIPIGRHVYLNFPNSVTIVVTSLLHSASGIVQQPIFRSNAVAKVNPSNCCNVSAILGIGNSLRTICPFTFLQSVRKQTVPAFYYQTCTDSSRNYVKLIQPVPQILTYKLNIYLYIQIIEYFKVFKYYLNIFLLTE